jgi:hypothetical protein
VDGFDRGVLEGLSIAISECDRLTTAVDNGGNEYRREAMASSCANSIRAIYAKHYRNMNEPSGNSGQLANVNELLGNSEELPVASAPPAGFSVEWQPIDTAPKDGTVIDLFVTSTSTFDGKKYYYRIADAKWGVPEGHSWSSGECWLKWDLYCDEMWLVPLDNEVPTHWMPIPASPTAASQAHASHGERGKDNG